MITKFSNVYAGHVDLGDMGQLATPANERRYPNEHLATVFSKAEAIARCMDEHGYHTLWLAEHHFQHEGYECIPNIMMAGVHLAHLTRRLRIGCGFNIAPMWHPLRLAEDYATADILTKGRVVFGVGRGYHTREVETFGAPMLDADANRDLFEEQVEIVMKAFNSESFSYQGKHYQIPSLKICPVPKQPIPILIGGHADPALKRAARLGDGWMHAGGDAAQLDGYLARLHELRREYGREKLPFEVHVIAMEAYTLDGVKRLEDRGITDCIVGFRNAYEKDTMPLQQKIDALRGYADRIIAKL